MILIESKLTLNFVYLFGLFFCSFRLTKQDFVHLSHIIVDTFPTEAAGTYYVPSSKSRNPTGKLLSAYTNLRHSLANVGIIAREIRQSSNIVESDVIEEVLVEVIDAMELIQNEVDVDQEQIMDAWKLTHESRKRDLKSLISTSEYLNRYPVLKQINGFEFVSFLSF